MKALTVCQPHAERIARRDKLLENRVWRTSYRGLLLIHAGLSRDWLEPGDETRYPQMPFGAIVAVANLVDCLPWMRVFDDYPSLRATQTEHCNGPFCWVLRDVVRLPKPLPWTGARGLWYVDPELYGEVLRALHGLPPRLRLYDGGPDTARRVRRGSRTGRR